jgi:DNA polymerase-3 subunit gamma/tau
VWDTRYRPLVFSDVLGQQGTVQVLRARLANDTALDTSYLFSGASGQGKTTLGRILARALLCTHLDKSLPDPCNACPNCVACLEDTSSAFVEKDAANQGTTEHIRKIVEDLPFAVFGARKRVYLFDECHRMSLAAQDGLLKPIEEKQLVSILCTTEPEKVRHAIRARCEEYAIRRITREDILGRMVSILQSEKVDYEEDAVLTVIDFAGGHVRDVLNRLEMLAQVGAITVSSARAHLNLSAVTTYYKILLSLVSNTQEALDLLDSLGDTSTPDEVASGLTEAAMNSYRLAMGMCANFRYADKNLGSRVFESYGGSGLIELVRVLTSTKYSTQNGLVCDLVILADKLSSTAQAPVQVQIQSPIPAPPQVQAAPQVTVPVAAPQTPTPAPQVTAPTPAPAPQVQAPVTQDKAPTLSFVPQPPLGDLGSNDVCALTEVDSKAMPTEKPGVGRIRKPLIFEKRGDNNAPIPPSTWRKHFEALWGRRPK